MIQRTYRMDENFHAKIDEMNDEFTLHISEKDVGIEFRQKFNDLLDMTDLSETSKTVLAEEFYSSLDELQIIELMRAKRKI